MHDSHANVLVDCVWVDQHCRQWKSDGWNNDADTFVCPINNATRGKPTPLPPVAKGDLGTPVGLAVTTLSTCGLLAEEYLRDMCTLATPDGAVASLDLEAPYSIEAERDTFVLLRALLAKVCSGLGSPQQGGWGPCHCSTADSTDVWCCGWCVRLAAASGPGPPLGNRRRRVGAANREGEPASTCSIPGGPC